MFESKRPRIEDRTFVSEPIEAEIARIRRSISDPEVAWMFENCFPNTLDTTVDFSYDDRGLPDSFIITGDIPALWLRDSVGQVWPYLPYIKEDRRLEELFEGLIRRHALCLRRDEFANSFIKEPVVHESDGTYTTRKPGVWERRWQLDSFGYVVRLAHGYWKAGGDPRCLDETWLESIRRILAVVDLHEAGTDEIDPATYPYRWQRRHIDPYESLPFAGLGQPAKRCGLIRSHFRPSDDFCLLPFHVPGNALTVVAMRQLAELVEALDLDDELPDYLRVRADSIETAIRDRAVVAHPTHGSIYAYEIDGYGGVYLVDDANAPSLVSLPYFGFCDSDDEIYRNTRRFALSEDNPYYVRGELLCGVSSAHVSQLRSVDSPAIQGLGFVWPQGIAMQAMTSTDDDEIVACLELLKRSHGGTGFMREVVWKNDTRYFRRAWFAWANSLFGEMIRDLSRSRPHLLSR